MSASGENPGDESSTTIPNVFILDEQKLESNESTEKQELFLLQWLAQVERECKTIDPGVIKRAQPPLEKTLLKLISLSTARPRRPIRFLIGRCYVLLYTRGDTRTLFDTVTSLHSLVNATKNTEKETQIAAISIMGAIMGATGSKVLSLFAESASCLLKVIKSSNKPLLLRLEAITAFTLLLKGAGKAATDPVLKELTKHLKNGLTDKALVIRIASAQCMQAVFQHTTQSLTSYDIETLLQVFFKAFDSATFPVRRAVSSLCATLLAMTQNTAIITDANKPSTRHIMTGEEVIKTAGVQENSTDAALFTVEVMLTYLSTAYNRQNASRELRVGLIETYSTLFVLLGTRFVETHYAAIVKHVLSELLLDHGKPVQASDGAFSRAQVMFLLHSTIGKRLLTEQGQASAIRSLITDWIKSWPPLMPNQVPPNKQALICATNLIASLVCELEGAASSVQDILIDPLFVLLTHSSFSVQIAAAWCIRCVCIALPSNLPYLLPRALNTVEKNVTNLANPSATNAIYKRTVAYAYTAAAIMSVFPYHPIHTSFELSARAMSLATQLLKNPHKEARITSIQMDVAWTLIGSLMCLGPNLVKLHLPQLLLLWKSALPKPTGKEAKAIRSEAEWSFSFHARERAVGSIYSFLIHNDQSLVTLDVAKRVAALLNNTLAFLSTAPTTFPSTAMSTCTPYETRLTDQYYALRRRIFQSFVTLRPLLASYEPSLISLFRNSLSVFLELDKILPSSGASELVTATVPGQYVSLWGTADGHGYGVTSRMQGFHVAVATAVAYGDEENNNRSKEWVTKDRFQRIEELLERPMVGSLELDPLLVYSTVDKETFPKTIPRPVAPSTAYIDASIELFATLFSNQSPPVQESTLKHIAEAIRDCRVEKNSPKRAALLVNVVVALLGTFKNLKANKRGLSSEGGAITADRATQLVQEILMKAVVHPDPYLRNAASEALGRLTAIVGGAFVATQMQQLVDLVVSNRDPDVRAGCALAIGYIYSHVGGMAASVHLKTLVGILLSLSSDPHPVVHAWALEAIAMTVSAAGLAFTNYVNSTLSMVTKLYLSETHEPGSGSVAVSNAGMSVGFSAYQEFGRIIYEMIGTLGPELQTSTKIRELCLNMVEELKLEPDERVNVEAIRCIQHFLMFAPRHLQVTELVPYLQHQIVSLHIPLKKAAVTCLYQLVRRDTNLVFTAALPGLDNELFKMLDTDPGLSDVKNVIKSWLDETAVNDPSIWVNITKRIVTGSAATQKISPVEAAAQPRGSMDNVHPDEEEDYGDDDADGFVDEENVDIPTSVADASGLTTKLSVNVEIPPRWRTQLFALQCLQKTIELVSASEIREHFDLVLARRRRQQAGLGDYLVFRLPDLIRLSFTAATAHVNELRLAGISLLRMVIEKFATTKDADLEGMLLLEQYAAQIGAALTPAFGAESSSEIVSAAVRVCAIYVGSGIVKDLYQLGRVLKLLTSALDRCKDDNKLTGVGEVKDLSPHASVMVKLSVLNAWAELQVASQRQDYLRQVLQPNLGSLSPLWLRSLQDYARIRLESDIVAFSNSVEGIQASSGSGIDSMYSAATKQVVLPFYRRSWLKIMEAVACLIESEAPPMMQALEKNPDGETLEGPSSKLCYILFGLCIESLSRISSSSSGRSDVTATVICLKALKAFVRRKLAGPSFLSKAVFLELMNVFDRLVQTEGYAVQKIIIEIVQCLIQSDDATSLCDDLESNSEPESATLVLEPDIFPSTAKLYYLLRLLVTVFVQHMPRLSKKPTSTRTPTHDTKLLLRSALDTLTLLVGITPASYKVDLLAISFYIYSEILADPTLSELAQHVLVSLKSTLHTFESKLPSQSYGVLAKVVSSMIQLLLAHNESGEQDTSIEIRKVRLLTAVLIMTGCPEASIRDASGRQLFVDAIDRILNSKDYMLVTTAHQCIRTFILLPEKKADSSASVTLSRLVMNVIIPTIVTQALSFQGKQDEQPLSLLEEDIKTLLTLASSAPEPQRPLLLNIILPTLVVLLDLPEEEEERSPDYQATMQHIIALARDMPQAFRSTVSTLPESVRDTLEICMRHSIASKEQQQLQQQQRQQQQEQLRKAANEPTIALKMDFSNFS